MHLDLERVLHNVRAADTEDLLDRATVYRNGMEPAALDLIESELANRGVTQEHLQQYFEMRRQEVLFFPDGTAMMCSRCRRPAVTCEWQWHRLFGLVPIFPQRVRLCQIHRTSTTDAGME